VSISEYAVEPLSDAFGSEYDQLEVQVALEMTVTLVPFSDSVSLKASLPDSDQLATNLRGQDSLFSIPLPLGRPRGRRVDDSPVH